MNNVGEVLGYGIGFVNDVPVGENVTSTMYAIAAPHGTKLKGKRLTSFVFAVYNGKIVFKHTDPNSAEQSFSFSSLRTKFLDDKNGTHATMLTEDVHQTDTVTLDGLTKGERFTLKGVVYNKSTRKPMLVDGKQVTNSIDFTAKGNSEEVALKYQYNGLKSDAYHKDKNDDLVSFVYLYKDGILIDKEEDFDSFDQTIKLPSCGTSASDGITKLHVGYASLVCSMVLGIARMLVVVNCQNS